jgi:hypothetical protein
MESLPVGLEFQWRDELRVRRVSILYQSSNGSQERVSVSDWKQKNWRLRLDSNQQLSG